MLFLWLQFVPDHANVCFENGHNDVAVELNDIDDQFDGMFKFFEIT